MALLMTSVLHLVAALNCTVAEWGEKVERERGRERAEAAAAAAAAAAAFEWNLARAPRAVAARDQTAAAFDWFTAAGGASCRRAHYLSFLKDTFLGHVLRGASVHRARPGAPAGVSRP
jgi:hypothetical protein